MPEPKCLHEGDYTSCSVCSTAPLSKNTSTDPIQCYAIRLDKWSSQVCLLCL